VAKKPKRVKPKPIIVPKWGAYLAALRGKVRPGVVVRKLRKMGAEFEKMSSAQQTYYEQGRVERPDPVVLWGYSKIYDRSLEEIVRKLAEERRANSDRETASESPPSERLAVKGHGAGSG
jgi:hypothetical protein